MFNLFYKLKSAFLTFFGDIKVYPYPMFIVYCPDSFQVKGADTREAMRLIRPGDLILRKYRHYLDGYFIPGKFSHTGVYVGGGKVIHAVAEGVSETDLIDFLRCDSFAILRPKSGTQEAIEKLHEFLGKPYDFNFRSGNEAYYCHELGAEVYPELSIKKLRPSLFGIKLPFLSKSYLAESFLTSPDFKLILQKEPNRKEKIMKKIIALFILFAATAVIVTGCTAVNTAAVSFHNSAVSFARTTSKAKAKAKIQELVEDGKITPEYGKELTAKADADLDAIFAKIDEYYAKYKVLKEAKLAAKKNTETKTADSAPAEKKAE